MALQYMLLYPNVQTVVKGTVSRPFLLKKTLPGPHINKQAKKVWGTFLVFVMIFPNNAYSR